MKTSIKTLYEKYCRQPVLLNHIKACKFYLYKALESCEKYPHVGIKHLLHKALSELQSPTSEYLFIYEHFDYKPLSTNEFYRFKQLDKVLVKCEKKCIVENQKLLPNQPSFSVEMYISDSDSEWEEDEDNLLIYQELPPFLFDKTVYEKYKNLPREFESILLNYLMEYTIPRVTLRDFLRVESIYLNITIQYQYRMDFDENTSMLEYSSNVTDEYDKIRVKFINPHAWINYGIIGFLLNLIKKTDNIIDLYSKSPYQAWILEGNLRETMENMNKSFVHASKDYQVMNNCAIDTRWNDKQSNKNSEGLVAKYAMLQNQFVTDYHTRKAALEKRLCTYGEPYVSDYILNATDFTCWLSPKCPWYVPNGYNAIQLLQPTEDLPVEEWPEGYLLKCSLEIERLPPMALCSGISLQLVETRVMVVELDVSCQRVKGSLTYRYKENIEKMQKKLF